MSSKRRGRSFTTSVLDQCHAGHCRLPCAMGAATEMALSAANDENVNTSPRSVRTRSRQHSTNSLFAKPFDSPVKRLLLQNDHSKRSPTKTGAARGAPGAPDHLLAGRSSPLAPVRTNVRTSAQQPLDVSTILDSVSLSTPSRAGGKTDGLGLHWDVSVDDRTFTLTSETRLDTTRSSHDSRSESKNQLSLSTQDLSVPDLRDPEFVSGSVHRYRLSSAGM